VFSDLGGINVDEVKVGCRIGLRSRRKPEEVHPSNMDKGGIGLRSRRNPEAAKQLCVGLACEAGMIRKKCILATVCGDPSTDGPDCRFNATICRRDKVIFGIVPTGHGDRLWGPIHGWPRLSF